MLDTDGFGTPLLDGDTEKLGVTDGVGSTLGTPFSFEVTLGLYAAPTDAAFASMTFISATICTRHDRNQGTGSCCHPQTFAFNRSDGVYREE